MPEFGATLVLSSESFSLFVHFSVGIVWKDITDVNFFPLLQEDQDAVRCMCYCGGYGCANVPQSKAVEIKYRLNPKIPDACYSRFLSADAGQTPPIGSGTMYTGAHYETKSADKDEDEDEDEDVTSNDIRIAGLTE